MASSLRANGNLIRQNGYHVHVNRVTVPAGRGGSRAVLEYGEGLLTSAEDHKVLMQVLPTHSSDDFQLDGACSLLDFVELMFARATQDGARTENEATREGNFGSEQVELPGLITQVWCEMACKWSGASARADPHDMTLAVLGVLQHFPWEAKMALALAALALNYGEFVMLAQMYTNDPLIAEMMVRLKQLPDITQLDAIRQLTALMLGLTKRMVTFVERSRAEPEYSSARESKVKDVLDALPFIAYWTIRSTIAAATHISIITDTTHDQVMIATATRELSMVSGKLNQISVSLETYITTLERIIEGKKEEEAYQKLLMDLGKGNQQTDVVVQALTYSDDHERPLFRGREQVRLNSLREKTVLLLITAWNERIDVLMNLCDELRSCTVNYPIVWVPVADSSNLWTEHARTSHPDILSRMPWHSVRDPSLIRKEVIRYLKQNLSFNGMPALVPLHPRGKISATNVLHMTRIWGNQAYPFNSERAKKLWKVADDSWLDLLLPNNIDRKVSDWVKNGKYIVVYGGEVTIEWITEFTNSTTSFAQAAQVELECVYVGRSCKNKTVHSVTNRMAEEDLGHFLKDDLMHGFWTRLDSMLQTSVELDKETRDNDTLLQEIKKIISYDKNVASWAVICKGSHVICSAHGSTVQEALSTYEEWGVQVHEIGFEQALHVQIASGRTEHNCFQFDFPNAGGKVPEAMKCPGCLKPMQVYTTFKYCHDDDPTLADNGTTHLAESRMAAVNE